MSPPAAARRTALPPENPDPARPRFHGLAGTDSAQLFCRLVCADVIRKDRKTPLEGNYKSLHEGGIA